MTLTFCRARFLVVCQSVAGATAAPPPKCNYTFRAVKIPSGHHQSCSWSAWAGCELTGMFPLLEETVDNTNVKKVTFFVLVDK